jgi:hypothetical protein
VAKLNLGAVLSNMAQAATGVMAGQTAAEAELRRRQLEQQERVRQQHQTLLNVLPLLDNASRQRVVGGVLGREANIAAGRPYDYQEPGLPDMSGYRGMFGGGAQTSLPAGDRPSFTSPAAPEMRQPMGPLMSFPIPGLPGVPEGMEPQVPFAMPLGAGATDQVEATQYVTRQAPSKPAAPAPRPGFDVPGIGRLSLKSVDPKEAQAVLKDIGETEKRIFSQAFVKDPNAQASIRSILSRKPKKPVDQWSEEDFSQAQQVAAELNSTVQFMSHRYPEIQMKMDRDETGQIDKDREGLHGYRPDNLQQELIRLKGRARGLMERGNAPVPSWLMAQLDDIDLMEKALASGDKGRAGLILGLIKTELTPKPKDAADPEKAFNDLLSQMPRWAGLAPEAQEPYLRRLRQMGEALGIDPAAIPNSIDRQMSEETKKRLSLAAQSLAYQERHRKFTRQMELRKQGHKEREDAQKEREKSVKLTPAQQAAKERLKAKRSALYQRQAEILKIAPVDLKPGSENAATKRLDEIENQIADVNAEIDRVVGATGKSGAAAPPGGKAATGAMMRGLADPNRPENRKTKPDPKWKTYRFDNPARLAFRKIAYDAAIARGKSPAEAAKWADEKTAGFQPEAKRK